MFNELYLSLYHTEYIPCSKNPFHSSYLSLSMHMFETTDRCTVYIGLPSPENHGTGVEHSVALS